MSEARPIATSAVRPTRYHWWYDSRAAGVRNAPPPNISGSPPAISPSPTDSPPKRRFSFSLAALYTPSTDTAEIYPTERKSSFPK